MAKPAVSDKAPTVSVVIPTYQRRELVKRAVASVLAQTYRDFELIVIDDGSTDGTGEALAPLGDSIRYEWQPNRGLSAARNAGLRLARGSIVAFLDSDNRWLPDHLAVITRALDEHPDAVLAVTVPWMSHQNEASAVRLMEPLPKLLIGNYVAPVSGAALRRETLAAVGGFDESMRFIEDNDLWLRVAARGGRFAVLAQRTLERGFTAGSLTSSRSQGDYVRALEPSTERLIGQLASVGGERAGELIAGARGRQHFLRALRALTDRDEDALRRELASACRLLPQLSGARQAVFNHVRFNLPATPEARARLRRDLAAFAAAWPVRSASTPAYLLAHATLIAFAERRPLTAVALLASLSPRKWPRFCLRDCPSAARYARRLRAREDPAERTVSSRDPGRGIVLAHRVILRTGGGPLRPFWRLAHEALARAVGRYLRGGAPGSSTYLKGGLGANDGVYGISDIDLAIVVATDPVGPDIARARVRRRWRALRRRFPRLCQALLEPPEVYEVPELPCLATDTALTHGLERPSSRDGRLGEVHPAGRERRRELSGAEHPGLYGRTADWRLVGGPELRPPAEPPDRAFRRIAGWMEVQFWWLQAFQACLHPGRPSAAYVCVKLVSEPVRTWLWLARGERIWRRREALETGLSALPDEEPALRAALSLLDTLRDAPPAPLDETLPTLARMSGRLARLLEAEADAAGRTEVRLLGADRGDLVLPTGRATELRLLAGAPGQLELIPLADWRARVWSLPPDEAIAVLPFDPTDPAALAVTAPAGEDGAYAALRTDALLVLPSLKQTRLRAVQCAVTDPVSFALVEGRARASFPALPGWSAEDSARRAVAEHLGWLLDERDPEPSARSLGRLLAAGRAALFHESLQTNDPELTLTVAAAAERLAARRTVGEGLAQEACGAYRAASHDGDPPPAELLRSLRAALVTSFPAYSAAA